jgi:hypothetical protein
MTQVAATKANADLFNSESSHPRSWIDALVHGIERIPGPSWLFYVVLLLGFAFLNNAVRWVDGSLEAGAFVLIRTFDAGYLVFPLAIYHHLSRVAKRSFTTFQPVLEASDQERLNLAHQISNLPRRAGWLALILGIALSVSQLQAEPEAFGLDDTLTLLPALYLNVVTPLAFACMAAWLIQTVRQLRLVNRLHERASEINLFQLQPVHAFSSLTARTGIILILFIVFSGLVESSNITQGNLVGLVGVGVLAVFAFALPLLGMRNRLTDEKARLIGEVNARIQVTIERIHAQVDSDMHESVGDLKTAMSALVEERKLIEAISTWPWETNTLRGFVTTLLLPIFLWLITSLLERLI